MTDTPRQALSRRLEEIAAGEGPVALWLVGGCGSGRSTLLARLAASLGPTSCQVVDLERVASTPERFCRALVATSPFRASHDLAAPRSPRDAFDQSLAFLASARRADGGPAVFLLDEVLELRTFESFPGLRTAMSDLCGALGDSPNIFVATSRFACRAQKLVARFAPRLEALAMPPLTVDEVESAAPAYLPRGTTQDVAAMVQALADGRPIYVDALWQAMASLEPAGAADPMGALAALMAPGGRLSAWCRYVYELRLHRARGYGSLKAILDVLAEEEPLTLTAIATRLQRTPGSTRDYLSWLEDVDLVDVHKKRYRVADPMLRLWIRLYRRPWPPSDADLAREVHAYARPRLAALPADAEVPRGLVRPAPRPSGIIEID